MSARPALEMAVHSDAQADERGSLMVVGMSLCAFSGFVVGVLVTAPWWWGFWL